MKSSGSVLLEKEADEQAKEEKAKQVKAKPLAEKKRHALEFLPITTYEPVGNPLAKMNASQRQFFMDSLLRASRPVVPVGAGMQLAQKNAAQAKEQSSAIAHQQFAVQQEQKSRLEQEKAKGAQAISLRQQLAAQEAEKSKMEKELASKTAKELAKGAPAASSSRISSAQAMAASGLLGSQAMQSSLLPSGLALPSFSSQGTGFKAARDALAFVLADYARGDEAKLRGAISEFESRLASAQHKSADLMATLLLVIEDKTWAHSGEEGAPGSPFHFGARVRTPAAVPEIMRENAKESAVVRLASVREMLRYYFEHNPKEYSSILAAALGMTADQGGDPVYMQERLAAELVHIGGFAFAQKLLAELKRKRNLVKDSEKCLLELGYRYDRKRRVLVLGKRTCGTPAEARGIVALLVAAARK